MKITDRAQRAFAEKESFEGRRPIRRREEEGLLPGLDNIVKAPKLPGLGEGRRGRRRVRREESLFGPEIVPKKLDLDIGGGLFGEGREERRPVRRPARRPIRREDEGFLFPDAAPRELSIGLLGEGKDRRRVKRDDRNFPIKRESYRGSVRRPNMARRKPIAERRCDDEVCESVRPTRRRRG